MDSSLFSDTGGFCPRCGQPRADEPTGITSQGSAPLHGHADCDAALALEPPRYCSACARRMVVQVTPAGWSATCVEHGTRSHVPV